MIKTYTRTLKQRMVSLKENCKSKESIDFKIMIRASSNIYSPEEMDKHTKNRWKIIESNKNNVLSKMFLY